MSLRVLSDEHALIHPDNALLAHLEKQFPD